jgi:hypothetical protein
MRQDENEDRLELSDAAPTQSSKLIPRLVIRDADITGEKAKSLLNGVGINISLTSANMLVNDARRMLRILDQRGLLHPDFERRRRHLPSDFIEVRRKKRRTA